MAKVITDDDFYCAKQAEVDRFVNLIRTHIAGKVRIVDTDGDIPIVVTFPLALALPKKTHPTALKWRAAKAAKEEAEEAVQDEAVD